MKKLFLLFAVAMMTVSASAQVTVEGSKFTDNWSIGIQGGLATKTNNNRWLSNLNANAGLRIGKEITPVFGLVAEGNVYFGDRAMDLGTINYTFAKSLNVNLLGKVNLSNLSVATKVSLVSLKLALSSVMVGCTASVLMSTSAVASLPIQNFFNTQQIRHGVMYELLIT